MPERFPGAEPIEPADASRRVCPECKVVLPDDWDSEFMTFDREYFEAHPGVGSFVRPVFPNEHPFCCANAQAIQVVEVEPGARMRRDVGVCHELDPQAEEIMRRDPDTPGVFVEVPPS
jgi:hypothetical protein